MSHFIATSIKVKPNGEIFCFGDENNVFPKRNKETKFHGDMRDLFDDIVNGNIQPIDSANNYRWRFAMIKSRESENMDERYELFLNALKTPNKNGYRLIKECGEIKRYIIRRGRIFCATDDINNSTIFNLYQATHIEYRYGVKIEII